MHQIMTNNILVCYLCETWALEDYIFLANWCQKKNCSHHPTHLRMEDNPHAPQVYHCFFLYSYFSK